MDQVNEVQQWLNNDGDYFTGVALYGKYGKNRNLHRFFSMGNESNTKREKLKYEMQKLAPTVQMVEKKAEIPAPNITKGKESPAGEKKEGRKINWPDEILLLIKEKGDLNNQRDIMHREVANMGDENDSATIAIRKEKNDRIDVMTVRIEKCRAIINKYEDDGVIDMEAGLVPVVPAGKKEVKKVDVAGMDKFEAQKKITSVAPQVSKMKKKLDKMPAGPKKTLLQRNYKAKLQLLAELKEKVK
jgi:hypothetical protein